jgi:hypothetical protein
MGYWTSMHLVEVRIKKDCRATVKRQIRNHKRVEDENLSFFLDWVAIDREGFLCFRPDKEEPDPYCPDEEGFVCAKVGEWHSGDSIAHWLKRYCDGGGIVFHSREGDGAAWGWEFDGQGKTRLIELRPKGKWI